VNIWTDTNATEMRQFCGLLLLMGLVRMPTATGGEEVITSGTACKTMTRNRFQLLLVNWHFADNNTSTNDTSKTANITKR